MQYGKKERTLQNFRKEHLCKFMKTAGIIAEYNPFHKGHEYQIRYTKEKLKADYVIVAMSGDYVQRGTPALISKHARAEMALRCGADLVLEMPVSVSTASAEAFAMGGVSLLDGLGVVDMLCFGSESGEISALKELAEILVEEPEEYKKLLKSFLSEGLTFPAARSQALTEYFKNPRNFSGDDFDGVLTPLLNEVTQILNTPNNILGIEYCKALLRLNSRIIPHALLRKGSGYHDTDFSLLSDEKFPSASGIRNLMKKSEKAGQSADFSRLIPSASISGFLDSLEKGAWLSDSALDLPLHYKLLLESEETLQMYPDLSDALIRRILKSRNQYEGFSQFADLLKTRDITRSAICRSLVRIFLNQKTKAPGHIPYARVLGFRKNSAPLLSQIKKNSSIPLITKAADASSILDENALQLFHETCEASNLYEMLLCHKTGLPFIHEMKKPLRII